MNIEKSYDCEKFNFEQIADMNDLIEKITVDKEHSKRLFTATIAYRDKEKIYTPSRSENTYTFGCRTKGIKSTVRIFYDFIDISDGENGYSYFENIPTSHMSDEGKIITALDKWESYYKD